MTGYLELLWLAAPETTLVLAALLVLAADLLGSGEMAPRSRRWVSALISITGCLGAAAWLLAMPCYGNAMGGMLVATPATNVVKAALLFLTALTLLLSVDAHFTPHNGEYCALVLLATIGMMFLVSAGDLLPIFASLELTSLCLYILTAFNKANPNSAEAAMKYFLFGGVAAAFTLFGFSLIYGVTGATELEGIARRLAASGLTATGLDPLLALGVLMSVAGFGFKIAAVPFHFWAPDVYQGAPAPAAALIASGSKVAGFYVLARLMFIGFPSAEGNGSLAHGLNGWAPLLGLMACGSMVAGNLAAIVQMNVRRLVAYSAVAHAGYMLLAVMGPGPRSMAALVYYTITYGLATLGVFAVISIVERRTGGSDMPNFAGLGRRSPALAFCLLIFVLSLAGIPPLAGFFGKFFVFAAALDSDPKPMGLLWLVALAVGASAVSLYYYLKLLKQAYVVDATAPELAGGSSWVTSACVAALALLVVLLGCLPEPLVSVITSALRTSASPF